MRKIGVVAYPPTEAMLEELEVLVEVVARRVAPGRPMDWSLLGLGPVEIVITNWKRRHNLFPHD